jgi:uncharacterized protein (TIGR00251 family)
MDDVEVSERDGAVTFRVKVAPRAKREGVVGTHGGALKIALTAPPVDGAANEALVALVAKLLGVPKRDVEIVRGASARDKTLRVTGATAAAIRTLAQN